MEKPIMYRFIHVNEISPDKTGIRIECCINCGSIAIIHFDMGEKNEAEMFHRCLRCLGEYSGCNHGLSDLEPRSRLL